MKSVRLKVKALNVKEVEWQNANDRNSEEIAEI